MTIPNALGVAFRPGLRGAQVELRLAFSGPALLGQLFWPVLSLGALFWLRGREVTGSELSLGPFVLPGLLAMFVAFGMLLMTQYLPADREDGTLLRARATPHGIPGYLIGKLATATASVLVYLVIVAVPGLFVIDGINVGDISWLTLAWVLGLGLACTQLLGAALGALVPTPRAVGYVSLPVLGLTAISGIFYPITALAGWLQILAQVFPTYWLGLGMRSAVLPDTSAVVEIGGSWRPLQTAAVLSAWTLLGAVVAPLVLRRMARRESGSRVADRQERSQHTG
jgi:ABC-2 type transport system permease protein